MGEKERITERRRWVMVERRKGGSLDDIHQAWNFAFPNLACSRATIASDIRESLQQSVRETMLATTEWRMLHIERIEKVLSGKKFQQKLEDGDLWTIDRFDRLMTQLIKLTGAYMPVKIAQTDPTGEHEAGQLSDEERAERIRQILGRAEERKRLTGPVIEGEIVESTTGIGADPIPVATALPATEESDAIRGVTIP